MKSDWIAVLILAAGQSSRFGKNKLLTEFKGKKIIEHTIEPYLSNKEIFQKILIVLGYQKDDFQKLLADLDVLTVYNQDYKSSGMSSSIKVGVSKILTSNLDRCKGLIIHPGDIPFVGQKEITQISKTKITEKAIIIPKFKNKSGHPLFFSRDLIKDLLSISDKEFGLRGYLKEKIDYIKYVEVNSDRILYDIDNNNDLKAIEKKFYSR